MVLTEILASIIEFVAGLVGAHGIQAGMVATGLVLLWHGHSVLGMIQSAMRTARIGLVSAALVAGLVVVGVAMGWISISSLPSLPMLPF